MREKITSKLTLRRDVDGDTGRALEVTVIEGQVLMKSGRLGPGMPVDIRDVEPLIRMLREAVKQSVDGVGQ